MNNTEILRMSFPRPDKKLLVLDVDRTIADFHTLPGKKQFKARPYLYEFLKEMYSFYDIIIWSGTDCARMTRKLFHLGIFQDKNFRIMACLDITHMQAINPELEQSTLAKPLVTIWQEFPQYNETNTIIVDDKAENFYFNPKNGLKIMPYFVEDYASDNVLIYLSVYLENLALNCRNFTSIDHAHWPTYQFIKH